VEPCSRSSRPPPAHNQSIVGISRSIPPAQLGTGLPGPRRLLLVGVGGRQAGRWRPVIALSLAHDCLIISGCASPSAYISAREECGIRALPFLVYRRRGISGSSVWPGPNGSEAAAAGGASHARGYPMAGAGGISGSLGGSSGTMSGRGVSTELESLLLDLNLDPPALGSTATIASVYQWCCGGNKDCCGGVRVPAWSPTGVPALPGGGGGSACTPSQECLFCWCFPVHTYPPAILTCPACSASPTTLLGAGQSVAPLNRGRGPRACGYRNQRVRGGRAMRHGLWPRSMRLASSRVPGVFFIFHFSRSRDPSLRDVEMSDEN
jgi:hypothetical protein